MNGAIHTKCKVYFPIADIKKNRYWIYLFRLNYGSHSSQCDMSLENVHLNCLNIAVGPLNSMDSSFWCETNYKVRFASDF